MVYVMVQLTAQHSLISMSITTIQVFGYLTDPI